MKCPHCNKTIRIKKEKEFDHPIFGYGFINLWLINFVVIGIAYAAIATQLDNYTSIPLSIADGLSFNLGAMMMLPIAIVLLVYCGLYRYKKVKGRFLIKISE